MENIITLDNVAVIQIQLFAKIYEYCCIFSIYELFPFLPSGIWQIFDSIVVSRDKSLETV